MQDDMRNRLAKITIKKREKKKNRAEQSCVLFKRKFQRQLYIFIFSSILFKKKTKKKTQSRLIYFFPHVILNYIFRLDDPLHYTKLSINP